MKRAVRAGALVCLASALVMPAGCDDGISKGWLVDRTRVLGARVEVAGDASRASMHPGETASITWLLAEPGPALPRAWSAVACVPPAGATAQPACAGALAASLSGTSSGDRATMALAVPDAKALGDATELLVLIAFCEGGTASLEPASFTATCAGGEPLLASLRVQITPIGSRTNTNPAPPSPVKLGDDVLGDGAAAAGASCDADPALVRVPAGSAARDLVFTLRAEDREAGESLLASTAVTAGTLDREYSTLDADEAAPKEIRVAWTPPSRDAVFDAGTVVRFVVAVRDGRGGLGFTTLAVCASH